MSHEWVIMDCHWICESCDEYKHIDEEAFECMEHYFCDVECAVVYEPEDTP